jgi:hypothetical protein
MENRTESCCFLGSFYNLLFVRNRTESCSQKGKTYGIVLYRIFTVENRVVYLLKFY